MPSIDQQLSHGEHVCYRARLHWIVLVAPCAVAACIGIVGLLFIAIAVIFWIDNEAIQSAFLTGIVALQVAAWIILLGLLHRTLAEIAITNRRVLKSGGLIKWRTAQLILPEIQSVQVRQSPLGHLLDFGSIAVVAPARNTRPLRYVSHPFEFRNRVEEQIAKAMKMSERPAA